jgi:hypothetical protein
MDAYDRCTNLEKKYLADIVAIYGRGRELFRPPTYADPQFVFQKLLILNFMLSCKCANRRMLDGSSFLAYDAVWVDKYLPLLTNRQNALYLKV